MYTLTAWFDDGTSRTVSNDQRASAAIASRCAPIFEDMILPFDPEKGIALATQCFYKNDPGTIPGTPMSAAGDDDYMVCTVVEPDMLPHLVRLDVDGRTEFFRFNGKIYDLRRANETAGRANLDGTVYASVVVASNVAYAEKRAERIAAGQTFPRTVAELIAMRDEIEQELGIDREFAARCSAIVRILEAGKAEGSRLVDLVSEALAAAAEAMQAEAEKGAEGGGGPLSDQGQNLGRIYWEAADFESTD